MPPHKELLPLLKDDEEDAVPVVLMMDPHTGRLHEDGSRSEGLHKGAAAVISKWPEHASSCIWIGVLITLTLFLLAATGVIIAYEGAHMPSCVSEIKEKGEPPIHTCVIGDIPEEQINLLAQRYPNKTIRVISLNTSNKSDMFNTPQTVHNHKKRSAHHNKSAAGGAPNVEIIHIRPSLYFQKSILHSIWPKLDASGLLLSCRALAVWNHGGTALDLGYYISELITECRQQLTAGIGELKDRRMCDISTISVPESSSPDGLLLGRDGLLLSSRRPCHAFAWDLLFAARVGARTAEDIAVDALETYCRGRHLERCRGVDLI